MAAGGAAFSSLALTPGCARQNGDNVSAKNSPLATDPRFLIVIGATGGASIIDSFLAIRQSETTNYNGVNAFPDAQVESVPGSALRSVNLTGTGLTLLGKPITSNQTPFLTAHKADMMVATVETTSVNHVVGQKRSVNGNGAWLGRTLQECVALAHGQGRPIPNANMGAFGYLEPGSDESLPSWCYSEPIANPLFWSLGLDGQRGVKNAPSREVMALARKKRDEKLDPESTFYRTFKPSERIKRWMLQHQSSAALETLDLISKLCILPNQPPAYPLVEYGLSQSSDGQKILDAFPKLLIEPLEAQAALAYLLIKNGISVSVTLSPTFAPVLQPNGLTYDVLSPPLAFDNSHDKHRETQGLMWDRILGVVDKLIGLLKSDEIPQSGGVSFWDRSLVYVATDFGRSKERQNGVATFGSGHDLNNGSLIVSPLANGNKVLGGVNPDTGLTYGFNLQTGAPDPTRKTAEAEIFSGVLGALNVDTTGSNLPNVPAMRKIA